MAGLNLVLYMTSHQHGFLNSFYSLTDLAVHLVSLYTIHYVKYFKRVEELIIVKKKEEAGRVGLGKRVTHITVLQDRMG